MVREIFKSNLSNMFELDIVVHEEREVLERDINVRVAAQRAVLLQRRLAAREGVLLDLEWRCKKKK